jgi:hypothetical protein
MKKIKLIVITSLLILLTLTLFSTVGAVPPLPSSFWGSAKLNGANLPEGTIIKAAIDGEEYAVAIVEITGGESVYSLNVPGDEASTPGVIEGGTPGDTIQFLFGATPANETGSWASGTNPKLDLTFTTTAPPVLPASYYGSVKIDGENAPAGTLIKASINGVTYAVSPVVLYLGEAVYSLNVPGDDPGTPGSIEGGVDGDSVQFFIGDLPADQTGTWESETNTEINLTASTPKSEVVYHFPIFYK